MCIRDSTHTHTHTHAHTHAYMCTQIGLGSSSLGQGRGSSLAFTTEEEITVVEKLKEAEQLMTELNETWEDKLKKTEAIQKER